MIDEHGDIEIAMPGRRRCDVECHTAPVGGATQQGARAPILHLDEQRRIEWHAAGAFDQRPTA